jgi:iron complex outermembrane recepter protein
VGDFFLNGILLRRGFDAVGLANLDRSPGSISPWRGNGFIQYKIGGLNLRYGVKYVDGVRDERCDGREFCATTNFGGTNFGRIISSFTQHDFHSSYNLPFAAFKTQLQFSVENFSDVQAPDARIPLGYNPFIGNPLGRVYRLGVTAGF